MAQWLASGRRRDICVLLYGTDGQTAQQLKRGLEEYYETYLNPDQFHGSLNALHKQGYIKRTSDGVNEQFQLTDEGAEAVVSHYRWLATEIDADQADEK